MIQEGKPGWGLVYQQTCLQKYLSSSFGGLCALLVRTCNRSCGFGAREGKGARERGRGRHGASRVSVPSFLLSSTRVVMHMYRASLEWPISTDGCPQTGGGKNKCGTVFSRKGRCSSRARGSRATWTRSTGTGSDETRTRSSSCSTRPSSTTGDGGPGSRTSRRNTTPGGDEAPGKNWNTKGGGGGGGGERGSTRGGVCSRKECSSRTMSSRGSSVGKRQIDNMTQREPCRHAGHLR